MNRDNLIEDRMKATSRTLVALPDADTVVEVLEVREFMRAGHIRIGEMTLTLVRGELVSMTISPCVV